MEKRLTLPLDDLTYSKSENKTSLTICYFDSFLKKPLPEKTPVLLFIHGNSASSDSFMPLFESPLRQNYRMIALDLPGHGRSDHLKNPEFYSLSFYSSVLKKFIEQLQLNHFVLVGHSLGGHIALEAIADGLNCAGLMIFGTPPLGNPPEMGKAFLPNPCVGHFFQGEVKEEDAQKAVQQLFSLNTSAETVAIFKTLFQNTDPCARQGLAASVGRLDFQDEIKVIENIDFPLSIVHGTEDSLISLDYLKDIRTPSSLWANEIQLISDSGHSPHWENPSLFNKNLSLFLESLRKDSRQSPSDADQKK